MPRLSDDDRRLLRWLKEAKMKCEFCGQDHGSETTCQIAAWERQQAARLAELEAQIADLGQRFEALVISQEALEKALDAERVNTRDHVEAALDGLQHHRVQLDDLTANQKTLTRTLEQSQQALADAAGSRVGAVEGRLDILEAERLVSAEGRLERLDRRWSALTEEVRKLTSAHFATFRGLDARVEALEKQYHELDQRGDEHVNHLNTLEAGLTELGERLVQEHNETSEWADATDKDLLRLEHRIQSGFEERPRCVGCGAAIQKGTVRCAACVSVVSVPYPPQGLELLPETACAPSQRALGLDYIDIVFDGPPGPQSGRFVEVESPRGTGFKAGEWIVRDDGFHVLRISRKVYQGSIWPGEVTHRWRWIEDGDNDLWSMSDGMEVLITAGQIRRLLEENAKEVKKTELRSFVRSMAKQVKVEIP